MKLKDIKPYPKNAKKHDQTQISNVAQSIKEFGFVQPIVVDKNNVIIIGHCRYLALIKLGYEEIPDDWVKKVDLSETDAERLRLLDNKTNESEWDTDLLSELVPDLDFSMFDLDWKLKELKEEEEKPEVEFTEVLGEENNYIILQFKSDIDWINAVSLFNIKTVRDMSTRKDGKITGKMERGGVGRVLDGAKFIEEFIK